MAVVVFGGIQAQFSGTVSNPEQIVWATPVNPRQGEPDKINPTLNVQETLALVSFTDKFNGFAPISDETAWSTGLGFSAPSQHGDYHFRLWVIPSVLNLSNPQLGTNIPFRLWNTWTDTETVTAVLVSGSSVLTFDIGPGTKLKDFEYRESNFQIGPGEPSIDALVKFVTENLSGELRILAAISDTFNLIPDVPVRESWEFLTDILTNYRGQEQRIALRRYPRITQEFDVEIINLRQRREQYLLLRKNIVVQSLIAFYQYATVVTATTSVGGTKIFFDPKRSNCRVGEFLVVVNTTTEGVFLGKITQIDADGVVVNTSVGEEIDSRTWVAMPAYNCIVNDGSGITMNQVTGKLSIKADTFSEPTLIRPGATRVIDTFDGIPFLNRRPLTQAPESFQYRRELIDNETGVRALKSRDYHPRITGARRFTVQRVGDPDEMDYWRSLFDTTRGSQKSFLLSTYFPDLELVDGQLPLGLGVSSFNVKDGQSVNLMCGYETWKRIQLQHSNGARTEHKITSYTLNIDGTATVNFAPALPEDLAYSNPTIISFLMRVRAVDRVAWEHYANYSEVSFGIITTDE